MTAGTSADHALAILSDRARAGLEEYARSFAVAEPFRHVVIDDFFDEALARELFAQFPPFADVNAYDEFGKVGGKAVVTTVPQLGPAYQRVDRAISQRAFLDWLGSLTGIEQVLYDPDYYGGGTHENRHGQELLPHVDFNYHPVSGLHRRLNVIVYLNLEWEERWGGAIEVHSNPRDPERDVSAKYVPRFNRCIVFETHESSWHGFRRIDLPPEKRHLSRKSLSLYFYSATRPEETRAGSHGTFYIPRPLADVARVGDVLDGARYGEVDRLLRTRDLFIAFYQKQEAEAAATLANTQSMLQEARAAVLVPSCGPAVQARGTSGIEPDGWVQPSACATFGAVGTIGAVRVRGRAFPADVPVHVRLQIGAVEAAAVAQRSEPFELMLTVEAAAGETLSLRFEASDALSPAALGLGPDERSLSWLIERVEFLAHAPPAAKEGSTPR